MTRTTLIATLLVSLACTALAACGGGGGSSSGTPIACDTPPITLDQGTWEVGGTSTPTSGNCSDGPSYYVTISQSGNQVVVTAPTGSYTGTLCGNRLVPNTLPFSYPEDGGITTIYTLEIVFQSGVEFISNSSWSWTDGFESCSGTTIANGYAL